MKNIYFFLFFAPQSILFCSLNDDSLEVLEREKNHNEIYHRNQSHHRISINPTKLPQISNQTTSKPTPIKAEIKPSIDWDMDDRRDAIDNDDEKEVKSLISKGADVHRFPPLIRAICKKNTEMVATMLIVDANPHQSYCGISALLIAEWKLGKNSGIYKLLKMSIDDNPRTKNSFMTSSKRNNNVIEAVKNTKESSIKKFKAIINQDTDINHINNCASFNWEVFHYMLFQMSDTDINKITCKYSYLDQDIEFLSVEDATKGIPLLSYAAQTQNIFAAKTLISLGANVNMRNKHGIAPLVYAVYNNDLDMVKLFIEAGANPTQLHYKGFNPLSLANSQPIIMAIPDLLVKAARKNIEENMIKSAITYFFIETSNCNIDSRLHDIKNIENPTENHLLIIKILKEADTYNVHPIEYAISENSIEMVKALIQIYPELKAKSPVAQFLTHENLKKAISEHCAKKD